MSCWVLTKPFASDTGFSADDGATLLMAFRGIQAETAQQGDVHKSIARELQHLVADPFEEWAKSYHVRHGHFRTFICPSTHRLPQERLLASRSTIIDGHIKNYERAQAEVRKSHVELLSRPIEVLRCRSLNSRIRIYQRFARQTRQKTSKYWYFLYSLC